MLNDPIRFIFWSPRLTIFGVLFDFVPFRALAFHRELSGDWSELETRKALLCFLSPFLHVFCEITGAQQTSHTSKSKLCIVLQSASHVAFAFLLLSLEGTWSSWLPCLPFLLVVFKASTTGGAGCRTCQTGDHGRVECHHRGTWPTRSTSYSVYNQLSFLLIWWLNIFIHKTFV